MLREAREVRILDEVAAELRARCRAFTRANLYHAIARRRAKDGDTERSLADFLDGPLADRLARGPLAGLLPPPVPGPVRRLPREWDAYFPAAILIVDRAQIVDLFAASGVVQQGRIAVVSLDGEPAHVVAWLRRGIERGHDAPVAFLHDADTVVYPFAFEPLATWVRTKRELRYRDLGAPPRGLPFAELPLLDEPIAGHFRTLEEPPPEALIAYAARGVLTMVDPDDNLRPLSEAQLPAARARRRR